MISALILQFAAEGLRVALAVLALRALPSMIALAGAKDCRLLDRAVAVLGYSVLAQIAVRYAQVEAASIFVAYAYLLPSLVAMFFVHQLRRSRAGIFFVAFTMASKHQISLFVTIWFAANGFLLVLWEAVSSFVVRETSVRGLRRAAAHVVVVAIVVAFAGMLP